MRVKCIETFCHRKLYIDLIYLHILQFIHRNYLWASCHFDKEYYVWRLNIAFSSEFCGHFVPKYILENI